MLSRVRRIRLTQPALFVFGLALRAAVLGLLCWKLAVHAWGHAGLCALTLALFSLPALAEALLPIRIPPLLEALVMAFAAAANLCGEMLELYLVIPGWDAALHVIWGFLAAVLGYSLPGLLSGRTPEAREAAERALLALAFAALTGVVWEFFEYFMDTVFHTDMQKDTLLAVIRSVALNPEGANVPVTVVPTSVVVNGESWPGYLDVGLADTMNDMLLNFVGSLPAVLLVFFDLRGGRRLPLIRRLAPYRWERGRDHNEKGI